MFTFFANHALGYVFREHNYLFLMLFVGSNYWQKFTPCKRRSFKR